MRSLPGLSLILAAVPAAAQIGLPQPPIGATYIEGTCGGGFVARTETVRVMANGRVMRLHAPPPVTATNRVAPATYAALSRRLDRANFDHRTTPRTNGSVPDGIDCTLVRVQRGVPHQVGLPQTARSLPKVRDLVAVLDDVMGLGRIPAKPLLRPVSR